MEVQETKRKKTEDKISKLIRPGEPSPRTPLLVVADTRGVIVYINPKFIHVTGYTLEEIVGTNLEDLCGQSTDGRKVMWDTIKAGGEWQGEFQNKKKSGENYWEFAQIFPVTNNDGVTTYFVKLAEDITALKEDGSWSERSVDPAEGGNPCWSEAEIPIYRGC